MTLTERYAEKNGLSKKEASAQVNAVINEIVAMLKEEGRAQVNHLGTFKVTTRAERMGRNPQTGDAMKIAAHKAVKFSAVKSIKEEL